MKRFIVCFVLTVTLSVQAAGVKHYSKLKYPPLGDIDIPDVQRETLPNGMQLFLLEDHELPLVHFSALIRTGSIHEPAEKIGLAAITGQVMRTGGTTERDGDTLDALLESMAASVEVGIGLNSGSASASALRENTDTILGVLAEVLMTPAFPEDKLALAKMQLRSSIARRNDAPGEVADREFDKLIYGADSVYARHAEFATLAQITRDDVVTFHRRYFVPNNVMLAVWGDFSTPDMVEKIKTAFADWSASTEPVAPPPPVSYDYPQTVNLINKNDVNQSHIVMGHIGGLRNDPDYCPLIIANRILGSSFTGRLFNNVRSRQGLAYSVYGVYTANYDYPGVFYVGCQTKSESTVKAIDAMRQEVTTMTQQEVSDEELALAKDSFLNSFIFNVDTRGKVITRMMTYAYHGYPADFLQNLKKGIEQVTRADVLRVAREHFHPDRFQILVVGRSTDFDRPLSVLGDVREIDITIPPPPQLQ
jgi:zinc protease